MAIGISAIEPTSVPLIVALGAVLGPGFLTKGAHCTAYSRSGTALHHLGAAAPAEVSSDDFRERLVSRARSDGLSLSTFEWGSTRSEFFFVRENLQRFSGLTLAGLYGSIATYLGQGAPWSSSCPSQRALRRRSDSGGESYSVDTSCWRSPDGVARQIGLLPVAALSCCRSDGGPLFTSGRLDARRAPVRHSCSALPG